jgi:hypothetical protein
MNGKRQLDTASAAANDDDARRRIAGLLSKRREQRLPTRQESSIGLRVWPTPRSQAAEARRRAAIQRNNVETQRRMIGELDLHWLSRDG